jgi:hypothetical protein
MTIKISQLGTVASVQGNVLVPVVSNITGTQTTVTANVDIIKTFIVAEAEANIVAANAATIFANTLMKSYVTGQITAANAGVTAANVGMTGYVDQSNSSLKTYVDGQITAANSAVVAANLGMKGYVDSISGGESIANVNMKNYVDGQVTAANAGVTAANVGMIGYVNGQISTANTGMIGYVGVQVTTANIGMKGYVDSQVATIGGSSYGNANVAQFLPTYSGFLGPNVQISSAVTSIFTPLSVGFTPLITYANTVFAGTSLANGYVQLNIQNIDSVGNLVSADFIATAPNGTDTTHYIDVGINGNNWSSGSWTVSGPNDGYVYINQGNLTLGTDTLGTTVKVHVGGTLAGNVVGTFNSNGLSVAGNVTGTYFIGDGSQLTNLPGGGSSYSNVNVAAYLNTAGYNLYSNINVAAYLTTQGITSYGNTQVSIYLSQFNSNIIPSANVTYSLGNVTNRWKDLYLSGNTIFLGDATITTEGGRLVTTGAAISPPTGAVAFANVQLEAATDFAQIRSYYVDNNFGYTANLTSWTTAPIVWDELRSAKIKINSTIVAGSTPDFESLDTVGGRFANAVTTLDATGNIASLTITDGGVGYDAYYPYYAADSAGYNNNYIGQSYTGSPTGKSFRRIGLIPTTASDVGNITSIGSFTRYSDLPTVGTNNYTWTGNTGTTISFTVDWSSNTVTAYTYTPALPALTSAQDWQNWISDYQSSNDYGWIIGSGSITGAGGTPIQAVYDYLSREALPTSLTYDQSATTWYPGNLLVNNSSSVASLSSSTFFVTFNRTSINYATLENSYGNPVYWSRGLSADTGISSGGDMTVAGDLRVAGDLYVSPTSIYMGDLRISAADGNLKVNTGIKFSDDSVQSSAYSNVQVAAYLTANPPASTYSNVQVATYLPTYTGNVAAGNVKVSNAYRFETGNVNITNESSHLSLNPDTTANALAGVKIGGSGYLLGPNSARNLTLNYGGISGALGIQANVTIGTGGSGNLFVVGNVIARDITGGNILATGTSGVLGFNGGGFAQQATSNATQVTSHFTSGNIQLMSIDLGASAVHTVTFACNKLTTNDLLLVKHISGGLTSVYVDAYVASDGLAVIWLRDITGNGTGAFTPMLKYAIIRAPSA